MRGPLVHINFAAPTLLTMRKHIAAVKEKLPRVIWLLIANKNYWPFASKDNGFVFRKTVTFKSLFVRGINKLFCNEEMRKTTNAFQGYKSIQLLCLQPLRAWISSNLVMAKKQDCLICCSYFYYSVIASHVSNLRANKVIVPKNCWNYSSPWSVRSVCIILPFYYRLIKNQ